MENKIIALIWWFIFMVVLPWDQEKIVVVSLVIFSYFLYYMTSTSIDAAFEDKKRVIKETLTSDIDLRISLLKKLCQDATVFTNNYNTLFLTILAKFNASITNFFVNPASGIVGKNVNLSFYGLNKQLYFVRDQYLGVESQKLLAVAKAIFTA